MDQRNAVEARSVLESIDSAPADRPFHFPHLVRVRRWRAFSSRCGPGKCHNGAGELTLGRVGNELDRLQKQALRVGYRPNASATIDSMFVRCT